MVTGTKGKVRRNDYIDTNGRGTFLYLPTLLDKLSLAKDFFLPKESMLQFLPKLNI